jgi:hypothetical protein
MEVIPTSLSVVIMATGSSRLAKPDQAGMRKEVKTRFRHHDSSLDQFELCADPTNSLLSQIGDPGKRLASESRCSCP